MLIELMDTKRRKAPLTHLINELTLSNKMPASMAAPTSWKGFI